MLVRQRRRNYDQCCGTERNGFKQSLSRQVS
jgi:hypothetical protein